jgi:dTDP-4-dehydrorhamnose reductase
MNRILISGAAVLSGPTDGALNIAWEQADPPATRCEALRAGLTNLNSVTAICEKYSPDVVIHCAGIAHQKIDPQITQIKK